MAYRKGDIGITVVPEGVSGGASSEFAKDLIAQLNAVKNALARDKIPKIGVYLDHKSINNFKNEIQEAMKDFKVSVGVESKLKRTQVETTKDLNRQITDQKRLLQEELNYTNRTIALSKQRTDANSAEVDRLLANAQRAYNAFRDNPTEATLQGQTIALKQLQIATARYADENRRLNAENKNTIKAQKELENAVSKARKEFDNIGSAFSRLKNDQKIAGQSLFAEFNNAFKAMLNNPTKEAVGRFNDARNALKSFMDTSKATSGVVTTLGDKIAYAAKAFAMMQIRRYTRQMYQEVKEIDSALTQLQIVTNSSSDAMKRFGLDVAGVAKNIAVGISDIVESSTTYARLGYSLEESLDLAKYTAMYSRVADVDVSAATSNITAMVKGFDIATEDLETALDKMTLVGNNFPISAAELGEGLQNAGSSLQAAGNSFEQAIALLTAAQTTTQDISKSSTAIRTISARIRNSTTDLGELNEELDEAYNTTAKYRQKLLALTNVDILENDKKTFKSTYEILREIAKVWDDIDDIDRASVTTMIAGTRQTNVFSSIMKNWQEAEGVVTELESAGGTLARAYDTYLDSIEGKLGQLKATFESLSQTVLSSDLLKGGISALTRLLNVLDSFLNSGFGKFATAVLTLRVGMGIFDKLGTTGSFVNTVFGRMTASVTNIGLAFQKAGKFKDASGILDRRKIDAAATGWVSLAAAVIAAIYAIGESIHKARIEVQQKAIDSSQEILSNSSKNSDYLKSIEDYRKILKDENSTYEESLEARKGLLEIQDQITEFYGEEAKGINVVTDSLTELNEQLDRAAASKSDQWIKDNAVAISDMEDELTGSGFVSSSGDLFSWKGFLTNLIPFKALISNLEGMQYVINGMPGYSGGYDYDRELAAELTNPMSGLSRKERLRGLNEWYDLVYKNNPEDIDRLEYIDSYRKELEKELDVYLKTYEEFKKQLVMSSGEAIDITGDGVSETYSQIFNQIASARTAFYDALAEGDQTKVNIAYDALLNLFNLVKTGFRESGNEAALEYYEGLIDGFNQANIEYVIGRDLKNRNTKIFSYYKDSNGKFDLSKLGTNQIFDTTLRAYAKRYNLDLEDELIPILIKLGYYESEVQEATEKQYRSVEKLVKAYTKLNAGVSIATKAMREQAQSGFMSEATGKELIDAFPDIEKLGKKVGDQFVISNKAIEEYISNLYELNRIDAIAQLAQEYYRLAEAEKKLKSSAYARPIYTGRRSTGDNTRDLYDETFHPFAAVGNRASEIVSSFLSSEINDVSNTASNVLMNGVREFNDAGSKIVISAEDTETRIFDATNNLAEATGKAISDSVNSLAEAADGKISEILNDTDAAGTKLSDLFASGVDAKLVYEIPEKASKEYEELKREIDENISALSRFIYMNSEAAQSFSRFTEASKTDDYVFSETTVKAIEAIQKGLYNIRVGTDDFKEAWAMFFDAELDEFETDRIPTIITGLQKLETLLKNEGGQTFYNLVDSWGFVDDNRFVVTATQIKEKIAEYIGLNADEAKNLADSVIYPIIEQMESIAGPMDLSSVFNTEESMRAFEEWKNGGEKSSEELQTAMQNAETWAEKASAAYDTFVNTINGSTYDFSQLTNLASHLQDIQTLLINIGQMSSIVSTVPGAPQVSVGGSGNAGGGIAKAGGSLVGEEAPEIVVDRKKGTWTLVGANGAQFVNLSKGDIVFNGAQTKALLKNGSISSRGQTVGGRSFAGKINLADGNDYTITKTTRGSQNLYTVVTNGNNVKTNLTSEEVSKIAQAAHDGVMAGVKDVSVNQNTSMDLVGISDRISNLVTEKTKIPALFTSKNTGGGGGGGGSSKNPFEDLIDWIEVRLERLSTKTQRLVDSTINYIGYKAKNAQLNKALDNVVEELKAQNKAYDSYMSAANDVGLSDYWKKRVQNGEFEIESISDEDLKKKIEQYQKYYELAEKTKDAVTKLVEQEQELAQTKFENITTYYDNIIKDVESQNALIEKQIGLTQESGMLVGVSYYEELIKNSQNNLKTMMAEREALEKELDADVLSGAIKEGSDAWYGMLERINAVDQAMVQTNIDTEKYMNSINQIKWDNFSRINKEYDNLSSTLKSLGSYFSENVVGDNGEWTNEGLTAISTYAQAMELATYRIDEYNAAINDLTNDYNKGLYSEIEYNEKLQDLRKSQWDEVEAHKEAKASIVALNKTRIDAVKDGIKKELDAYKELINLRKSELDAQKESRDYQKTVSDQSKKVTDLQKRLNAMANDDSASAAAQRKKIQEELFNAQEDLENTYYNHSIETQKKALDDEYKAYEETQNEKIAALEEYLTHTEQVVADSVASVLANGTSVLNTYEELMQKYNISINSAIVDPWENGGKNALTTYGLNLDESIAGFDSSLSTYAKAVDEANGTFLSGVTAIKLEYEALQIQANTTATAVVEATNRMNSATRNPNVLASQSDIKTATTAGVGTGSKPATSAAASSKPASTASTTSTASKPQTSTKTPASQSKPASTAPTLDLATKRGVAAAIVNGTMGWGYDPDRAKKLAEVFGANNGIQAIVENVSGWGSLPSPKGFSYSEMRKKFKGYAGGTLGVPNNQFAWLNEKGDEIALRASRSGTLSYLTKGTSVIPADITKNLMELGKYNVASLLSKYAGGFAAYARAEASPTVFHFDSMVHVDNATSDSIPLIERMVRRVVDDYNRQQNYSLKKYTR